MRLNRSSSGSKQSCIRTSRALLLTVATAAMTGSPAFALTGLFGNGGGDGTWENPNNWFAGVVPGEGDNAWIDSGFTVTSTGNNSVTGEIQIGLTANAYNQGNPGGAATLNIVSGTLEAGAPLVVGQGNGAGATDSDGIINIAAGATLRIKGGRVLIGFFGKEATTETSGTVNVNGGLFEHTADNQIFHVGGNASDGSYNAGFLNINNGGGVNAFTNGIQVGARGPGTINIDNGTLTNQFYFSIGTNNGNINATANVTISGGTLSTGEMTVNENNANLCSLIQTGGTVNIDQTRPGANFHELRIGRSRNTEVGLNAGKGLYDISGGSLNTPQGDIWVGDGNHGELKVSGTAAVNVANQFCIWLNRFDRGESIGTVNQTGGTVSIGSGSTLGLSFGANGNATYNLDGGTLTLPKISAAGGGGTKRLAFNGGTLIANNTFTASGDMTTSLGTNGGTINSGPHDMTWNSPISGNGTLTKTGDGTLTITGDNGGFAGGVAVNAGTLLVSNMTGSGVGSSSVSVATTATLGGTGVIGGPTLVNGTLAPGATGAAGSLWMTQGLSLNATAKTAIQLAGSGSFDVATVSGTATLAGALQLSTLAYTPAYGQSHRIVDATTVAGRFATVEGNAITANKWLAVTYDTAGVVVTAALPGDADLNTTVGFDDLLALAQSYNLPNRTWSQGDFNGTGTTDFDDLLTLAQYYNQSAPVGGAADALPAAFAADWALAQSLVPEPSIALLAPLGLMAMARRRRAAM